MPALQVQHFLGRARDFFEGAKFLGDDLALYRYSAALLGIHGALAYADALRVGMGSAKLSSDDHLHAVHDLKSLLSLRKYEKQQGVDRLRKLLSKKSRIAYTDEATTEKDAKDILVDAERFAAWAEDAGKKLQIEGW